MEFVKDKKIIIMSLMDLEHCGFSHDDYLGELFLSGIDDPEAEWPILVMVNFAGGTVIMKDTPKETLDQIDELGKKFKGYLDKVVEPKA